MEKIEQQIGIVEKIFDYPDTFNMFWMEKRLVVINTRSQATVSVGLIPSLIGEGFNQILMSHERKKKLRI